MCIIFLYFFLGSGVGHFLVHIYRYVYLYWFVFIYINFCLIKIVGVSSQMLRKRASSEGRTGRHTNTSSLMSRLITQQQQTGMFNL